MCAAKLKFAQKNHLNYYFSFLYSLDLCACHDLFDIPKTQLFIENFRDLTHDQATSIISYYHKNEKFLVNALCT